MKAMTYVAKNAGYEKLGDFMKEWRTLDEDGKDTLKQWARDECAVLGVPLEDD